MLHSFQHLFFFLVIPDSLGNIQAKVRGVRKVEKGFAVVTVVNVYGVLSANQELYFTCNFQSSQETGTINCTQEDSKAYLKLVSICPSAYSMREIQFKSDSRGQVFNHDTRLRWVNGPHDLLTLHTRHLRPERLRICPRSLCEFWGKYQGKKPDSQGSFQGTSGSLWFCPSGKCHCVARKEECNA